MITNCLIINLDTRKDLWDNLENFRTTWIKENKKVQRIPGGCFTRWEQPIIAIDSSK